MKVIIAAAGTGGHINPGIAIANKIMKEQPDSEIIFIGTNRGLETDLVPKAGYELKTINSYGFSKKLTITNIKRMIKTFKSIGEARRIVKDFKPDIIIGTGGYICVSVCLAAKKLKMAYIIHESNALPGLATKVVAKNANRILVGFKEAKERLQKCEKKVVVTGSPTKTRDLGYDLDQIEYKKRELGFDKKEPLVLIFGGSQGAKNINNSVKGIIEHKKNIDGKYQICWAAGPEQYDIVKKEFLEKDINIDNVKKAKVYPYIYNMEEVMNVCDLVVARSGAMTITEIEEVGKPAIFIPLPNVSGNHQEYNARALEDEGAARVILDKDLNEEILDSTIRELIVDKGQLKEMAKASKRKQIKNVEENIYKEVIDVLNEN